jgi:hypothetical protein
MENKTKDTLVALNIKYEEHSVIQQKYNKDK